MTRRIVLRPVLACAILAVLLALHAQPVQAQPARVAEPAPHAEPAPPAPDAQPAPAAQEDPRKLYRLIRRFDFDERPLGNFEHAPMHWRKLEGPGLPFYADGRFDEQVGHAAAPSFALSVATGNVAYEYDHLDLTVLPHADYVVEASVRGAGLEHARAFVAAYLVDRFAERIPGSERVSALVGDTSGQWQRVTLELPGDYPSAYALRLQVWVLHAYAWRDAGAGVDPIIRRDTDGQAWFDDVAIYSLPRARLRFSNPAGVVEPGQAERFIVDVNNASSAQLEGQLRILDAGGRECMRRPLLLARARVSGAAGAAGEGGPSDAPVARDPWGARPAIEVPVPELPPGWYEASLQMLSGGQALLERHVRFAVLPGLGPRPAYSDIGIDLGAWPDAPVGGARDAARALGVGAVRVGVPMAGALDTPEKLRFYTGIGELIRTLAEARIETCGVILSASAALDSRRGEPTLTQVRDAGQWTALAGPVFAHFGGLLTTWQAGDERIEQRAAGGWTAGDRAFVRAQLLGFISYPELVVPHSASSPAAPGDWPVSFLLDPRIPTADVPRMLEFLREPDPRPRWVRLVWDERDRLDDEAQRADRARRLVLAKALAPDRLYVPAPLTATSGGGVRAWEPTRDFLWLRTLTHYLSGRRAVAALRLKHGAQVIVFDGPGGSCAVAWSQCPEADEAVELYLGAAPVGVTLAGRRTALPVVDGRTRVPLAREPLIITSLNTELMLLQASYAFAPRFVQVHEPDPKPRLTLRNPYDSALTGEVVLTCPPNWQVAPARWSFALAPGERLEQELACAPPNRQLAGRYPLQVAIRLHAPEPALLRFDETLELGLRDVELSASAFWEGDALVVEQRLRNRSTAAVGFNAFCQPPGWGKAENAFRHVPAGQSALISYVFPAARGLAGAVLHHGIEEIRGPRRVDQVVQVPP